MLYLAARFLYMDAQTWDRQPYWAQRIYAEGLMLERPWQIKTTTNPREWSSPLDESWDTFGELDTSSVQDDIDHTVVEDSPVKLRGLPDITSLGAPVTKIKLGQNK